MTLEDFFTSTEMKDGLKAPAQVKELIKVMENDKHNIVKSVGDAIEQWSTVARIITATENKDCLALFLQLNGLHYVDTWLKDSQKFVKETGDSSAEDSITALLGAINKLNVDRERSVTSGIMLTVNNLLSYKNSRVQDMARDLFDSWKQSSDSIVARKDVQKVEAFCQGLMDASENPVSEHERPECSSHDTPPSGGIDSEENNVEPGTDEIVPEICPETTQHEGVDELIDQPSDKLMNHAYVKDGPLDPMRSSDMLTLVSENNSVMENSPTHRSEVTTEIRSSGPEKGTLEGHQGVTESNEHDHATQMPQIISCDKLSATNTSFCGESTNTVESKVDATTKKDVDAQEGHPYTKKNSPGDDRKEVSEENDEMCDNRTPNHCSIISAAESTAPVDGCNTDVMQDSSISEHNMGKNEELTTYSWRKDDTEAIEESNDQRDTDEDEDDLENDSGSRSGVNMKDSGVKKSDFELEYGMFDPLDVARQVAIEVEREVDCREQSCSSSERTFSGGSRLRESLYSTKAENSQVVDGPFKDMSAEPTISAVGDRPFIEAKNLLNERDTCILGIDPSRVTETAQTSEPDTGKRICDFDLNESVMSDERDDPINPVTAPISLVTASRATAASGLPVSPLQFEGILGWKGSAETSAFRPAPPRKISEAENSIFASDHSNNLRQRQEYLDFDLNVSGSEDNNIADLTPSKEVLRSSGLPFGDGSLEAHPNRSDHLQLDLNCVSDGGDAPSSNWKREGQLLPHWNGHLSPSPSSSSSAQASLIDINLNNQPYVLTEFCDPAGKSSPNLFASGGSKPNEAVISLMGAKVEVNRKNIVRQTIPFVNSMIMDPALDGSMIRNDSVLGLGSSSIYAHPSIYGYNSPMSAPAVPFSSPVYGHGGQLPYMVDSRGSPVVPQVLGSVSALPPAFSQPSFVLNMAGAPSDPKRFLPPQQRFDLNSGLMMEGGNRDGGSLRQLFNTGQGISIGENMRTNSESTSSSGVGGKRKETDGGWDRYPFNYKHHQPPWK